MPRVRDSVTEMAVRSESGRARAPHEHERSTSLASTASSGSTVEPTVKQPNQFINISFDAMVAWLACYLADKKPPEWVEAFKDLFKQHAVHTFLRTQQKFQHLATEYADIDPTAQAKVPMTHALPTKAHLHRELTVHVEHLPQGVLSDACKNFMDGSISTLMATSGFTRLPKEFLEYSKKEEGRHGLDVHVPPSSEVPTHVYYRETYQVESERRSWKSCFQKRRVTDTYFRNVAMVYAFTYQKDDAPDGIWSKLSWLACNKVHRRTIGSKSSEGKVFLRCYNDIPLFDMDMLMPGSKPNPKFIHALFVLIPFVSGFGAGMYKVVESFTNSDNLTDVENLLVVLFAIIAPLTASFKAFIAAKNRLTTYRYHHAQMLIDHTISTNDGCMMQLLAEAATQENKEAVLAYTAIALSNGEDVGPGTVRKTCHHLLGLMAPSIEVEFDSVDAMAQLTKSHLLELERDGELRLVDVTEAKKRQTFAQFT